eukprot:14081576-Alexandrium_andersonii.AAC.1
MQNPYADLEPEPQDTQDPYADLDPDSHMADLDPDSQKTLVQAQTDPDGEKLDLQSVEGDSDSPIPPVRDIFTVRSFKYLPPAPSMPVVVFQA